jgi:tetratricopeptide (TPR) repeat protein
MNSRKNNIALNISSQYPVARIYGFALFFLFVILYIIYGNSFTGEWHFDDYPNIVENASVHLTNLTHKDIVKTFYFRGNFQRPVSYLSFALNYYIAGSDTYGYHLVNFAIHYITAVFLFLFIYNTLKLRLLRDTFENNAYSIALLATVLWAINPVQVLAVSYIVQRMAILAGMFYISAMYFYLKGRTAERRGAKIAFFLSCIISVLLAFGSKENAAMLPLSIFIYDLFLIQGVSSEKIKKNLIIAVIPLLMLLGVGLFYTDLSSILKEYAIRPFTLTERLLTETRVIFFYVSLLFYPRYGRLALLHDTEISKSLIDPWTTIAAILGIMLIICVALFMAKKKPLVSFCILFFFLNHVIEGSIFSLELIYEHRNYIPSMFIFVLAAVYMLKAMDYFAYNKLLFWLIAFGIVFVIADQGHTVYLRNEVLKSDMSLWRDNMNKYPELSRPYHNIGVHYVKKGRRGEAIQNFEKALALNRDDNLVNRAIIEFNIGNCYLDDNDADRALEHYQKSIKISGNYGQPFAGLAELYLKKGNANLAYQYIQKALEIDAHRTEFRELLSLILLKKGDIPSAEMEAIKLLQWDINSKIPLFIIAETKHQKGRDKQAIFYLRQLLKKHPLNIHAYLFLIELYDVEGNKEALEESITNLMFFKDEKKIEDFVCTAVGNRFMSPHSFDTNKILSIIKKNLTRQAQNIKAATCNRL